MPEVFTTASKRRIDQLTLQIRQSLSCGFKAVRPHFTTAFVIYVSVVYCNMLSSCCYVSQSSSGYLQNADGQRNLAKLIKLQGACSRKIKRINFLQATCERFKARRRVLCGTSAGNLAMRFGPSLF